MPAPRAPLSLSAIRPSLCGSGLAVPRRAHPTSCERFAAPCGEKGSRGAATAARVAGGGGGELRHLPLEHAERAEAGRVAESGGLGEAAPPAERLEVGDVGAVPPRAAG